MKKILSVILCACLINVFSNMVQADEPLPTISVAQTPNTSVQTQSKKEKFKELRAIAEKFHKEKDLLADQMKNEKDEAKLIDLRKKLKALFIEFQKDMNAKRAQLGLPVKKESASQDRAEKFQELRSLIEQFQKDREAINARIKAEKDQGKIKALELEMRNLFRDFKNDLNAKRAQLGLPDPEQKVK